jgi:hypothetical protein
LQEQWQGLRAYDAVNDYLKRERSEKEERDGQQIQQEQAGQVRPVWRDLVEQSAIQHKLAACSFAHTQSLE